MLVLLLWQSSEWRRLVMVRWRKAVCARGEDNVSSVADDVAGCTTVVFRRPV
jgi:hypothetical protein